MLMVAALGYAAAALLEARQRELGYRIEAADTRLGFYEARWLGEHDKR